MKANIEKEVKILEIDRKSLSGELDKHYSRQFQGRVLDKKFDSSKILDKSLGVNLRIRTKIFDIISVILDTSLSPKVGQKFPDHSDNIYKQTWTIKQKVKNISDGTKEKKEYSENIKSFEGFLKFVDLMKKLLIDYKDGFTELYYFQIEKENFQGEKTFLFFIDEILGISLSEIRDKHRIQWKGKKEDSVKWTIDEYKNIPPFSEVEGKTKEIIWSEIEKFGLSHHQITDWGYKKLKKHYGK